jgi:nitroreductase
MLVAKSFGVATIAQAAIAMQPTCVRQFLGIPDNRVILFGLSFGYADQSHPANSFTTRRDDLDLVVEWYSDQSSTDAGLAL